MRQLAPRVSTQLAPFVQAGVFEPLDTVVPGLLSARLGVDDPLVVLGLALAVRAPRTGSVCVDLASLQVDDLQPAQDAEPSSDISPSLPADRGAWLRGIQQASGLVRGPDDLALTPFVVDQGLLYMDRYWRAEVDIAERLIALATAPVFPVSGGDLAGALRRLFPGDPQDGLDPQVLAGATALLRRLCVITGGPGMGKTWTVRNLLALLWVRHQARRLDDPSLPEAPVVALAAPTGKAAGRVRESILTGLAEDFLPRLQGVAPVQPVADWLQGLDARTLHRLLGMGFSTRPRYDADNPLPYDVIVVDEASMIDLPMMGRLLAAVGDEGPSGEPTRLVILGDPNQLASVEAGSVLADVVHGSGGTSVSPAFSVALSSLGVSVPAGPGAPLDDCVVPLTRNHRFTEDSAIGAFARACVSGSPGSQARALLSGGDDLRLIPHGPKGSISPALGDQIVDAYRPYLSALRRGFRPGVHTPTVESWHRLLLDLFGRFRVLCALRRGPSGAKSWNREIAHLLTRAGLIQPRGSMWPGRPVLVTRNDYGVMRSSGEKGLFNGDVGLVVEGPGGALRVAFPGTAALPATGSPPENLALVDYVSPQRLPPHATVFAMTIHKSQGSEFDHAMIVLPTRPGPVLTRELVYTGVTRARRRATIVGTEALLRVGLSRPVRRASGLAGRLVP